MEEFKYIIEIIVERHSSLDDFYGCLFYSKTFEDGYKFAIEMNSENKLLNGYKEFVNFRKIVPIEKIDPTKKSLIYDTYNEYIHFNFTLECYIRPITSNDIIDINKYNNCNYYNEPSVIYFNVNLLIYEYLTNNILLLIEPNFKIFELKNNKFKIDSQIEYKFKGYNDLELFPKMIEDAFNLYIWWEDQKIILNNDKLLKCLKLYCNYYEKNFQVCSNSDRKFITHFSILFEFKDKCIKQSKNIYQELISKALSPKIFEKYLNLDYDLGSEEYIKSEE